MGRLWFTGYQRDQFQTKFARDFVRAQVSDLDYIKEEYQLYRENHGPS